MTIRLCASASFEAHRTPRAKDAAGAGLPVPAVAPWRRSPPTNYKETQDMHRSFIVGLAAITLAAAACATTVAKPTPSTTTPTAGPAVVADLAPTGKLRLAVWVGPEFLAHGNPPAGIAVDLATKLASRLGVPLVTTIYDSPPALLAAAQSPGWDVALLPILPATSNAVDFAAPMILIPHTLLVRSGSSISTMAQADQPGITIASEAGKPHTAVLASRLKKAKLVQVASDTAGLAMLNSGQVDAFADGRFAMSQDMAQAPGSHVLTDNFFTGQAGLAVTKGHAAGLAYLIELVDELKASGAVQQAITAAGVSDVPVAPPGSGVATAVPTTAAP
jgi:polar amino acid transport system substrate-binding protein